ncbi:O-antigen ligase family protein [Deinococcus caeni]|uniref:O-antigen ligase family protein n=1 Tax=Deinococcus caeni TaxID=569127 RepID=UPI0036D3D788
MRPRNFSNDYSIEVNSQYAASIGQFYGMLGLFFIALLLVLNGFSISRTAFSRLWPVILFYLLAILSQWFSAVPTQDRNLILPLIMFLPLILFKRINENTIIRSIQRVVIAYALSSLAAIIISPNWALESNYSGSILPGIDYRLHGMAVHANTLSGILIVYYAILMFTNYRHRFFDTLIVTIALILTQSKTSFVVVLVLYLLFKIINSEMYIRFSGFYRLVIISLILVPSFYISQIIDGLESNNQFLGTLLARQQLWQVSIDKWRDSPAFGYGPKFWDYDMSNEYFQTFGWNVPHAHNEFFQILGSMGSFGILALIIFLILIVRLIYRSSHYQDLLMVFLIMFIIRGTTEIPLRQFADSSYIFMFFFWCVILLVKDDRLNE